MSIVRHPAINVYGVQRDLQREVNRLLENFFPAAPRHAAGEGGESVAWRPMVDIHEDAASYVIDAELPGLSREDVKINFQDGTLTLSGERSYKYEKKETPEAGEAAEENTTKSRYRTERLYGKFNRSFTFSSPVDADGITARFDSGVLTVTVPKAHIARPRQIDIQ